VPYPITTWPSVGFGLHTRFSIHSCAQPESFDPSAICGRHSRELFSVIPAKAGIQACDASVKNLVSRLRGNDDQPSFAGMTWASLSEGAYVLRSNVSSFSAEDLWRTYVQLNQAESAFRIHKSELHLRPMWHQKEERVLAHILVCFLAFAMWKTLEGWMKPSCRSKTAGRSLRRPARQGASGPARSDGDLPPPQAPGAFTV